MRLGVVDGHQHLPITGDDQALRLVEPLRKTPDTVHLDQAVRRIQGRLEPGDAARLVAQDIDPAIRADRDDYNPSLRNRPLDGKSEIRCAPPSSVWPTSSTLRVPVPLRRMIWSSACPGLEHGTRSIVASPMP